MLMGASFDLYQMIIENFPTLRLLASGGITSVADLEKLDEIGVYGAVIGKAYYEGKITLKELARFLHSI
jgi:phosphoribosylformimino-5-aminoimidazole carboxamide ribotide isomerase